MEQQLVLGESFSRKHNFGRCDTRRAEAVTWKVAGMLAIDCQPYSIMEDWGFSSLTEEVGPNVTCYVNNIFLSIVLQIYKEEKHSAVIIADVCKCLKSVIYHR
jgi:hypothetical protein